MVTINALANLKSPGVVLVEDTAGPRVVEIASHSTIYMIGTATIGAYDTPTLIRSVQDFTNQFGASPSTAAVRLLFRNYQAASVYFVRTTAGVSYRHTITAANDAEDYALDINGTVVTYTATAADTTSTIATGLAEAINANVTASAEVTASADANIVFTRLDDPADTLTISISSGTMADSGAVNQSGAFIYTIENTFDLDAVWPQGFVIAPEAFQTLTDTTQRVAVGAAMEALAANKDRDWVAFVDGTEAQTAVADILAEGQRYATVQGHLAFYAPYVLDPEGEAVPPSAAVAAIACKRPAEQGFHQPPAGVRYPLRGVTDVVTRLGRQSQDQLNPAGINLIRYLNNRGVVVWGMRTRAADPFYTFVHRRVIMNVLNGTLRNGFDEFMFDAIDGFGILFARIEDTARTVCETLWIGRALFGATANDAFAVKCDFENNSNTELEKGNVLLEVYAAPSPAVEKLLIASHVVAIGNVQNAVASGVTTTG